MSNDITICSEKYFEGAYSLVRPKWVQKAFDYATGSNIKVAVIDSGCSIKPMEDSRIEKGISFIHYEEGFKLEKNDNYFDLLGHGTTCIDIILQIAPAAEIVPIKVFNSKLETSIEILVEAINYAIEKKVDIINLSLGTKLPEALYPLYSACEKAKGKEIIIISANANTEIDSYPAIFENVISVVSGKTQNKFEYYFYDDELCECIANGFLEDALTHIGTRVKMNGNSFAAPIITGIVSLMKSKYGQIGINRTRRLLKQFSIAQ